MSIENQSLHSLDKESIHVNEEIASLVSEKKLKVGEVIGKSFNTVLSVEHPEYGELFLRISDSPVNAIVGHNLMRPESCGYFDPDKHKKERRLLEIAQEVGIQVPRILEIGRLENGASWCIETKVDGRSLDSVWPDISQTEKIAYLNKIGGLLAQLHKHGTRNDKELVGGYWSDKIDLVVNNLKELRVYSSSEVGKIKDTASELGEKVISKSEGRVSPVHLELILKHIFVNNTGEVTGVIDWETGEVEGDSMCDLAFTSFWNSGEGSYTEKGLALKDPDSFKAILRGYNKLMPAVQEDVLEMIPFYDLMWYLNILWVRSLQGETQKVDRRKKVVSQILSSVRGGNHPE